jgi:hypothetical protein
MDEGQTRAMRTLSQLLGMWRGEGIAEYPTTPTFPYREELEFTANAVQPALRYEQRTWKRMDTGEFVPSHWEVGFWHALSESDVELTCTAWGGRAEVLRGTLAPSPEGFVLTLHSTQVANDPRIGRTAREFALHGGSLSYSMQMSTTAVPDLTLHARAELSR